MTAVTYLLAVSRAAPAGHWPEPLAAGVAHGKIHIESAAGLHQAAVRLVNPEIPSIAGLLIDTDTLTRSEIQLLETLKRHRNLPMWVLPTCTKTRPRYQEALRLGVLPWNAAGRDLAISDAACTQEKSEGSSGCRKLIPEVEKPDKNALSIPACNTEMPLPEEVAARYDEVNRGPILSDQEMRALLGTP